ncbi:MAG: ParA family protein [Actinomycetota bacterium]|nr:ParA family protein [Actinomycetota bacterium]
MRTIAVVNQKGGTAKTTSAVNLAATLAEAPHGRRVLLVDLDPQHSATDWLLGSGTDVGKGLFAVLGENVPVYDVVYETPVEGVDIVPSSSWLVGAERALAGEVGAETILRRKLSSLDGYDYVLMDCPPQLGILTVNALVAASEVLVPVEAHVMALAGLAQLVETVELVQDRLNPDLDITGIVACRVDARTRHAGEVVGQLRERFGDLVFRTVIRENVRLAEAPSFREPITAYDPRSAGAEDHRALAAEVVAQENGRGA